MWENNIKIIKNFSTNSLDTYIKEFRQVFSIPYYSIDQIKQKLQKNKQELYPEMFTMTQAINNGDIALCLNVLMNLTEVKKILMLCSNDYDDIKTLLFSYFVLCPETLLGKNSHQRQLLFLFFYFSPYGIQKELLYPKKMKHSLISSPKITLNNFKMLLSLYNKEEDEYLCHDLFSAKIESLTYCNLNDTDKTVKYLPNRIKLIWAQGYTFKKFLRAENLILTKELLHQLRQREIKYHKDQLEDKLKKKTEKTYCIKI